MTKKSARIKADDFSAMEFNPFDLRPGQLMYERYRRLARRNVFVEPKDEGGKDIDQQLLLNELTRFVVLFVDNYANPLAELTDFDERAEACLDAIGGPYIQIIKKMLDDRHYWILELMLEYFKLSSTDEYTLWFSLKMQFYEGARLLASPMATAGGSGEGSALNARDKIRASMPQLLEEIKRIELRIFQNDRQKAMIQEAATSDALGFYAEKHAQDYKPLVPVWAGKKQKANE